MANEAHMHRLDVLRKKLGIAPLKRVKADLNPREKLPPRGDDGGLKAIPCDAG